MSMNKKIGIMGGTFDPPHIGHLTMAERVREELKLDEVWFLPTGGVCYKDPGEISPPKMRLAMVQLAVAGNPKFRVNSIEVESGENSYTYRTLATLNRQNPDTEFVFIVGADSLDYMDCWREPERIFGSCMVAAVNRQGISMQRLKQKQEELSARFGAKIELVDMPVLAVSSTEIRHRVQREKSIRYLVPDDVRTYILKHGLYRNQNETPEKS